MQENHPRLSKILLILSYIVFRFVCTKILASFVGFLFSYFYTILKNLFKNIV